MFWTIVWALIFVFYIAPLFLAIAFWVMSQKSFWQLLLFLFISVIILAILGG